MYAAETITRTPTLVNKIRVFQNHLMRWMFGYKLKDRIPITTLKSLTQLNDITANIKKSKVTGIWYGHLRRSSVQAKSIAENPIPGYRKRGRPSRRWLQDIKDWSRCEFPQLFMSSTNRDEWSRICNNLHWSILFSIYYDLTITVMCAVSNYYYLFWSLLLNATVLHTFSFIF